MTSQTPTTSAQSDGGMPALRSQDIVIFGGTGSLARLKLLPALYDLTFDGLMPPAGLVIGLARTPMSDDAYRELARQAIALNARNEYDESVWQSLAQRLRFVPLDQSGYNQLRRLLTHEERLVYLALPPSAFGPTARALAAQDLIEGARLLIEKPFGRDLESAIELDRELRAVLHESQIFRIDHYLGKETVQNILVFRFGNSVFERVWHRDAVHHIEITVAESDGIGQRGSFYEEVGALRDIVQNHLLQILSVLTMEPPASFDAESIRDEKAKLLRAVTPLEPQNVVRGQYAPGSIDDQAVKGYLEEANVPPGSQVETFIAARVEIANWRWAGVPIFLRTGKRLPYRATEIEIAFRDVPTSYFAGTPEVDLQPNTLTLCIQPQEEITFSFLAKVPAPAIRVKPVTMNFSYDGNFSAEPAEAYQRLIHDAMMGDHTLFVRADSVERAWRIVQPIVDAPPPLHTYAAGTWGPAAADDLIAPLRWHLR
jgi:glucose-6-phosphate 1-dehydrogenase